MNCSAILPGRWPRRIPFVLGLVLLALVPGCSKEEVSHYQRKQSAMKDAVGHLEALGGKVSEKHYPEAAQMGQANGNVVVLAGVQNVDEEVFDRLKFLGRITELDLSKTNVTDAHMERINEHRTLLTLNLSNTNVTDQGLNKLTGMNVMLRTLILTGTKTTGAADEPLRQRLMKNRSNLAPMLQDLLKLEIRR